MDCVDQAQCEALFSAHEKRAAALVNRYCRDVNPNIRHLKDDIMSEAMMALWKCCLKAEETTNNTFWTFAYLRVQGSIIDYLRREKLQVRGDRLETQVAFFSLDSTYKMTARWDDGTHREMKFLDSDKFVDQKYSNYIHTLELQTSLESTYRASATTA